MFRNNNTVIHFIVALILTQVVTFGKTTIPRESDEQTPASDENLKTDENNLDSKIDLGRRISRILLEGDESEIQNVNITELLTAIHEMSDTKVPLKCLTEIWKEMKEQYSLKNISVSTLETWKDYYRYISEKDFRDLSERDDIEASLISKSDNLNKRLAVIFMLSLLEKHEKDYFLNHTNLNILYTILCGMPRTLLFKIPPNEYAEISGEVFEKLNTCSLARLRRLLLLMMRSTVHGPTQAWTETIVEKLNLLLLALEPDELRAIHPAAMRKISPSVIDQMNMELILTISKEQISNFNFPAFLAYKRRFFFTSNQMYYNKISFNYYVLLWIILVFVY
ncbi:hypothetical protein WA026_016583 [Henosepilachna vigintioctopunctata]|uniref:Uncharacterized protein n=1 Tax=Henosepilachna vigintioctopunctata TaxID=420089 RepID=A0AAW1VEY5_9CUCU